VGLPPKGSLHFIRQEHLIFKFACRFIA